jgi:hypothetical protein
MNTYEKLKPTVQYTLNLKIIYKVDTLGTKIYISAAQSTAHEPDSGWKDLNFPNFLLLKLAYVFVLDV